MSVSGDGSVFGHERSEVSQAVVACRPVDWSEVGIDPEHAARLEAQVAAQRNLPSHVKPLSGVYPDSVVRRCAACDARVWVGPRSMEAVRAGAMVACYRCIAVAQGRGWQPEYGHLGNPETPRRAT